MDQGVVGSGEEVTAYCIGFISLAAGTFSFMYGLIGMREAMVEKSSEMERTRDESPRRRQ